jgi:uncharacterized protein
MKSPLCISIQAIEPSGLSFEFEVRAETFPVIADLIDSGECRFTGPVHIEGRADRTQDLIEVIGSIRAGIRLSCSRCLNEFETVLSEDFALTFSQERPQPDSVPEPAEKELTADEFGMVYFRGEVIDLKEPIQEHIVMMLPQRPLCSESCKGLCAQCGADLNQGECDCRRTVLDDRFAILKNFKVNTDKD